MTACLHRIPTVLPCLLCFPVPRALFLHMWFLEQKDVGIPVESFRQQGWHCHIATTLEKLMSYPFHILSRFDVILVTNEFNKKRKWVAFLPHLHAYMLTYRAMSARSSLCSHPDCWLLFMVCMYVCIGACQVVIKKCLICLRICSTSGLPCTCPLWCVWWTASQRTRCWCNHVTGEWRGPLSTATSTSWSWSTTSSHWRNSFINIMKSMLINIIT